MRLVFAGTPEFAEQALAALIAAGFEVPLVLTQPDRPSGRGLQRLPSAVKRLASSCDLPVYQPQSLKDDTHHERLRAAHPDVLVVAAYGLLLPRKVLELAPLGAINIHASLLPRWRGAAPIQRALLAGDRETGISIMQMDEGLDTGPVLAQQAVAIGPSDDTGSVHDRLAMLGATMIVQALRELERGTLRATPQPTEGACYAPKVQKAETLLDWSRPALELERCVRAFRPAPGAVTRLHDETIKIWRAHVAPGSGVPGELLQADAHALLIASGEDALAVSELQRPGGRRLTAGEFLRGRVLRPGTRFGTLTE